MLAPNSPSDRCMIGDFGSKCCSQIGGPMLAPPGRAADLEPGGMVFAGGPDEVADRILHLHELLGHSRQILQMDVGGMPQATFLKPSSCSAPGSCPDSKGARSAMTSSGTLHVAVFGATGNIGRPVVEQLLGAGYHLTAYVRTPDKLTIAHPNLTVMQGELDDRVAIARALDGADAVISALGPTRVQRRPEGRLQKVYGRNADLARVGASRLSAC